MVTAARASFAPGPNGVPYKVYKHCSKLLRIFLEILQVIWCRGTVAELGGGCLDNQGRELKQALLVEFRYISCLSLDGNNFFSVQKDNMLPLKECLH